MNDVQTEGTESIEQTVDPPLPRPVKAPMVAGAPVQAIVPRSIDDAWRIAGYAVAGGWAPRGMTRDAACTAIMHGMELGLRPMTALQRIAVINGRPAVWGELVPAIAINTGQLVAWDERVEGEGDNMVARCMVARRVSADLVLRREETFSVQDAKTAGLWQTEKMVKRKNRQTNEWYVVENDSPWYRHPKRMLQMRARRVFRDLFADSFCGFHIAEELIGEKFDLDLQAEPHEIIHNPLQEEAGDEVPPKQMHDDRDGAPMHIHESLHRGTGDEDPLKQSGTVEFSTVAQDGTMIDPQPIKDEFDEPTGEPPPKAAAPRRKAQEKPEAKAASDTAPAEKAAPGPAAGRGGPIKLAEPYIKRTPAEYVDYVRQWTTAAVLAKDDPASVGARFIAERAIRNSLKSTLDADQLGTCKAYVKDATTKLGGTVCI